MPRHGGCATACRFEVVSALSVIGRVGSVTSSVIGHLTAADARAALEKAGWLTGKEVSW